MISWLLLLTVALLDQISKAYIRSHLLVGASIPVIDNVFHITYILNPGAAFGIMAYRKGFFILVALVLVGVIGYFYPRIPRNCYLVKSGLGLMAGGAVGNVIDRIRTGYVVDFFDFRIWPVFNIADIAIVGGVACLLYYMLQINQLNRAKKNG